MAKIKLWSAELCSAIKERLAYSPETGDIIWKTVVPCSRAKVGDALSSLDRRGYIQTSLYVRGKEHKLLAHRIAYFLHYGVQAHLDLDHTNHNITDNRICNLRIATKNENMHNRIKQKNNRSGFKGVSFSKAAKKYRAEIRINRQSKFLGYFNTPEAAHVAYQKAAVELHKEFANFG